MKIPFAPLAVCWLLVVASQNPVAAGEHPSFKLEGFAALPGYGLTTTTGGGDGAVTVVKTPQEFRDAVERTDIKNKKQRDGVARVIRIANDLDLGELANEKPGNELKSVGTVRVGSNTTIFADGEGVTLRSGTLDIHGAANVIIRNLKFRDLWENDPTGKYDKMGWDFVRITNSGKVRSHHIWVDHCDFGKVYDGALDVTHGSDLVTISWCRFGGDERGPQMKVTLIGHSSSSSAAAMDTGRLNVTLHHNYYGNIIDRAPRTRFGNVHFFNNVVDGANTATMSVMKAVTLVENSFYRHVAVATSFSHAADNMEKGRAGTLTVVGSRNEDPRPASVLSAKNEKPDPNLEFELANNFKSSVERSALQFNAPADWAWENRNKLPYEYHLDPVEGLSALVSEFAGVGKVPDAELVKPATGKVPR